MMAASISTLPILFPEVLITSSALPRIYQNLLESMDTRSPWYQTSLFFDQYHSLNFMVFQKSPCHWGPWFLNDKYCIVGSFCIFENVCDLIWLAFHMPIYCVSENLTFATDKPFRIRNPYDWSIRRSYFLNHFKFRSLDCIPVPFRVFAWLLYSFW